MTELKFYAFGPVENDAVEILMRCRADGNRRRRFGMRQGPAKDGERQQRRKENVFTHKERDYGI